MRLATMTSARALKAATYADVSALQAWTGVAPHTDLATGIERFVAWYRAYHA